MRVMGASELGIMWRRMICAALAPRERAASTKVCSRRPRMVLRIRRASFSQPSPARISMMITTWRASRGANTSAPGPRDVPPGRVAPIHVATDRPERAKGAVANPSTKANRRNDRSPTTRR